MDAEDFVATVHLAGGGMVAEDAAFLRLCRGYKFEDLAHWVTIQNVNLIHRTKHHVFRRRC